VGDRVVAVKHLNRHHPGERGVDLQAGDVVLPPVERHLLAVALQFQDA
jgi:hypothetical protein